MNAGDLGEFVLLDESYRLLLVRVIVVTIMIIITISYFIEVWR